MSIKVNKSYAEITRILGPPTKINPGEELINEKTVGGSIEKIILKQTTFCYWDRPEAEYFLTFFSGNLSRIYDIKPKNVSASVSSKMEYIIKTQPETHFDERKEREKEESERIKEEIKEVVQKNKYPHYEGYQFIDVKKDPPLDKEKQIELDKIAEKNRKKWEKEESERIKLEIKEKLEKERNKPKNQEPIKNKKGFSKFWPW